MTGYSMKRKIAAALAAMMISGCMPFNVLAEELQEKPLVELIVPFSLNEQEEDEVNEEKPQEESAKDEAELIQAFSLKEKSVESAPTQTEAVELVKKEPAKPEGIELVKKEPAKPEGIELVKKEPAKPEGVEPVKKEPAKPEGIELVKKEPAKPEGVEPIKKDELKLDVIEPVKRDELKLDVIEPVKKDELKLDVIEPVKRDELKLDVIEPVKKDESKLEAIKPLDKDELKLDETKPVEQGKPNLEVIKPVKPELKDPPKPDALKPLKPVTQPEFAEFEMTVSVKDGLITVKVTGASDKGIQIEVSGNGVYAFNGIRPENGKGSGVLGKMDEEEETIAPLDPGTYTVCAFYESEESIRKQTTVTIAGSVSGSETPGGSESGGSGNDNGGNDNGGSGNDNGGAGETEGVKAFTILPVVTDGSIAVVVDGASSREVEVKLIDKDGKTVGASAIIGSGLVQLGKFASGTYTVSAQYTTPVVNADGTYDYKQVSAPAIVPEGVSAPDKIEAVDIEAKIEKGKDYIIITVTKAADIEMMVSVDGLSDKAITKGGSVRYDGLTPGESYAVQIDYINYVEGAKKYAATVTLDKPVVLGEIKITAVTPGTNKLTVSGTATAGQQVILTTTPAAASDVYAMANDQGVFSAEIACAAGTYTAVTAKYSADTTKTATAAGNWVVAAPAQKPTLSVDPIDSDSVTVVGKTTAGVIVEIQASDYTQKVTADSNGVVRFSLPHTYAAGTKFTFVVYYGSGESFTQTAEVAKAAYTHTLEYGWEGDEVRKLTARLEKLGYPVKETKRYGSTVREAVRLFQLANGLKANGIADPKTQKAIFSVGAIPYGSDRYPTLVRGDKGLALIYTLQQRLKDLGYYTIKVDGIFGSGTQRAVREFQRVNGLTVTGKANHATQALLYSSAAKSAGSAVSGDYKTLSRSGKYKSAVVPLQKRLRALGYYSGNIDGYFGSQTYRAVRNFQNRNGLTVTGVADPYTQQVLYSASARTYSGGTASSGSSSSGYRLLYWGCRGDAVTRLQRALIEAGYKSIVRYADGIFGRWTYDAVRAYQKDHGLAVDGIAGKNTQNSLYGTHY